MSSNLPRPTRAPRSAAERMRLYRRRRREGALLVRVRLDTTDIAGLAKRGYLGPEDRDDLNAVEHAAEALISDALYDG